MLGLDKGREVMEPDALLFQAPKEPLYDPILLGSIGSHELLPDVEENGVRSLLLTSL